MEHLNPISGKHDAAASYLNNGGRIIGEDSNVYDLVAMFDAVINVNMPHILTLTQGANTTLAVTRTHVCGVPIPTADSVVSGRMVFVGDELTIAVAASAGYNASVSVNGVEQTLSGGECVYNVMVGANIAIVTAAEAIPVDDGDGE